MRETKASNVSNTDDSQPPPQQAAEPSLFFLPGQPQFHGAVWSPWNEEGLCTRAQGLTCTPCIFPRMEESRREALKTEPMKSLPQEDLPCLSDSLHRKQADETAIIIQQKFKTICLILQAPMQDDAVQRESHRPSPIPIEHPWQKHMQPHV